MEDNFNNDYSGMIGNPYNPVLQGYSDTCAIKSQQLILNEFGIPVTEDQLVIYSEQHGWYHADGTGTQPGDVGKLLMDAGIPCTQTENANVYDLVNELAQGHKVIVGVDSSELWNNSLFDSLRDLFIGETADHALIVAGIDFSDPENPMVILTDPGTGEVARPYPLDQFMDAWGDSHNFMVSTDIPTPQAMTAFTEYGMTDMHLPDVAGVDYGTFLEFQQYSHFIEPQYLNDLNLAFHEYSMMTDPDFNTAITMCGLPDPTFNLNPELMMHDPLTFDYAGLNNSIFELPNLDGSVYDPNSAAGLHDPMMDINGDYLDADLI